MASHKYEDFKDHKAAWLLGAAGGAQGVLHYYIQPHLNAKRAWGLIGLGVLAYEVAAPPNELLSNGVDRVLENHPVAVRALIGYTALHLMNALPENADLFHKLAR